MRSISLIFLLFFTLASASPAAEKQVVGSLPYSNQWEFEKSDSYIFLVYDPQTFSTTSIRHGDFNVGLGNSKTALYGLNYYTKLTTLASTGQSHLEKELAAWLRFSLELANPSTSLDSDTAPISSASNTGQLFMGRVGAGSIITWSLTSFLRPFIGAELWGYAYRHSASINAVDFSGQGFMIEPLVGAETRIIEPIHAVAQVGFNRMLSSSHQSILGSSTSVSLGIGAMF